MTISASDVQHVARLAELDVPELELDRLRAELDRILEYVAQLGALVVPEGTPPFIPGPQAAPLRPDEVGSVPLARPPAELAADVREGLFIVPRLASMDSE